MTKEKKHLEISLYTSVPKVMIICYTVPEIWCVTDVIIVHFGLFFALLPPSSLKNQNKRGNWKNDSSTLHLEVWTRYFRPRYSIKVSGTSVNLKIIKPHQCSPERSHLQKFKKSRLNIDRKFHKKPKCDDLKLTASRKKDFFEDKLLEMICKPKELWQSLKSVGMPNKTAISNFNAIEGNVTLTYDTRSISKNF